MATTIEVAPLTRIEGHLDIEVSVEGVGDQQRVVDARCSGPTFRGFEIILKGRDPLDAPRYTQRICGVCPISHGMASSKTLEAAFSVVPTNNGRILRNLILGGNFLQSHVLHFYHLALLDYVDTTGLLNAPPWQPRYATPDMVSGDLAADYVAHYVQALEIRRKAHQMAAVFGGKLPCSPTMAPGGCTEKVTSEKIDEFRTLLSEISWFVNDIHVPDVELLAQHFPTYYAVGRGCGNLLAYGVFDLDATGQRQLFRSGVYTDRRLRSFDARRIAEYVKSSYFAAASSGLNPSVGVTEPVVEKSGAYSWVKSPRYLRKVHEVGPLARMVISGNYRRGVSVMDRLMARALEAKIIAAHMDDWLDQLVPGEPTLAPSSVPASASGIGLTEAPRGALGHWMEVAGSVVDRYQVITPTAWNASPKDDFNRYGPIEHALLGTPVADPDNPVELLRVVHSFDPCMACSVHLVRPRDTARPVVVRSGPRG